MSNKDDKNPIHIQLSDDFFGRTLTGEEIAIQQHEELIEQHSLIGFLVSEEMEINPGFEKIINGLIEKHLEKTPDPKDVDNFDDNIPF